MYRYLHPRGELHLVERAWLGKVLSLNHRLAVQTPYKGREEWFLALHHFPKSSVLLWPLIAFRVKGVEGDSFRYFEPSLDLKEPILLPVTSLAPAKIMGVSLQWKSWLWQLGHLRKADLRTKWSQSFAGLATSVGR